MTADLGQDEHGCPASARVDAEIVEHAFGQTANPEEYIERSACETVLRALDRALFEFGEPAALIAPPGMGKSLLLRVFSRRCADRVSSVELAYGAMPFEDLCEWTLRLFGETVGDVPSVDFEEMLRSRELLLTIDDASSLPEETARLLGDFARRMPKLHVILATSDGFAASRMLAAFGDPVRRIRFAEPMNLAEARAYMAWRLKRWGASFEMIDRLGPATISRLLRLSGGVPRRVHLVAPRLLLDRPNLLHDDCDDDDDWLGDPIEDGD